MNLKIRKSEQSDMKHVLQLIKELAIFEKEPNAVEVTEKNLIDDGFNENPAFQSFLAILDDEVVGMVLFYQRYSTWKGKSIHLEDLIVKDEHRHKGIGSLLYAEVMKYAHDNHFKRVAWEVLDWNKQAINFYKHTGANVFDEWRVAQMDEATLKQFVEKVRIKENQS